MENTQTTTIHCPNCNREFASSDKFCPSCGQRNLGKRISFAELIKEFFSSLFNIDSRIFRSIRDVFLPGKMVNTFLEGRRKYYVHPVRFFLVVALLMIAILNFSLDNSEAEISGFFEERNMRNYTFMQIRDHLADTDLIADSTRRAYVVDSLINFYDTISPYPFEDTVEMSNLKIVGENTPDIALRDFYTMSPDELIERYNIDRTWDQLIFRQKLQLMNDSKGAVRFFIGNLTWVVVLIFPLFALILRLIYIRRDFNYVEHFVHTMHLHTVGLLSFAFFLVLAMLGFEEQILIYFPLITLYIFLSMKFVYKQGWFKTLLKIFLLFILYSFVLTISFVFTFIVEMLIY